MLEEFVGKTAMIIYKEGNRAQYITGDIVSVGDRFIEIITKNLNIWFINKSEIIKIKIKKTKQK